LGWAISHPARETQLTKEDIDFFRNTLGPKGVVEAEDELESHNTDWLRKYRGESRLALRPHSAQEVSKILKYCNDRKYVY